MNVSTSSLSSNIGKLKSHYTKSTSHHDHHYIIPGNTNSISPIHQSTHFLSHFKALSTLTLINYFYLTLETRNNFYSPELKFYLQSSCMGLPNCSDLILSEQKMLKFQEKSQTILETTNFCNEEEKEQEKQIDMQKEGSTQCEVSVSCLKITKMSPFEDGEEEDVQCTTPTSKHHRIQVNFPATPKKPKMFPSTKRKRCDNKRVLLDCSKEIESLFPTSFRVELGVKSKKVRASFA